jgi:hypothetical protein
VEPMVSRKPVDTVVNDRLGLEDPPPASPPAESPATDVLSGDGPVRLQPELAALPAAQSIPKPGFRLAPVAFALSLVLMAGLISLVERRLRR